MITQFSGFIMLRKPKFNYDKQARGAFRPHAPKINNIYYNGIDRMPWFEVDEAFYSNKLPDDIKKLRSEYGKSKLVCSDFELIWDLKKAKQLLEFSNKFELLNEIVVINSNKHEEKRSLIDYEIDIISLGIDIYCHGYGSLIREGLFSKPQLFSSFIKNLNIYGLFEQNEELIDKYITTYIQCSKRNNIEPVDNALKYLDIIQIGRVERI